MSQKTADRNNTESADRESSRWRSVYEVAAHLGVKPATIYKWLERKSMPAHKVGRLWKFKISEIDQWVRAGGSANK